MVRFVKLSLVIFVEIHKTSYRTTNDMQPWHVGRPVRLAPMLALLAILAVAMPTAWASFVEGDVRGSAPVQTDGEGDGSGRASAVFVANTAALAQVRIQSPHVHVSRFDARYVDVGSGGSALGIRYGVTRDDFELHDVTISLTDPGGGWLGGEFAESAATFVAPGSRTWSMDMGASIGDGDGPDNRNSPYFSRNIQGVSFGGTVASIALEGMGEIKWMGPTFEVVARENRSTWRSGTVEAGTAAGLREQVWYVLDFAAAQVEIASDDPIELRSRDLALEGLTALGFTYRDGALDVRWSADSVIGEPGQRALLRGSLAVGFDVDDADPTGFVARLSGDVATSTLAPASPIRGAGLRVSGWLAVVAAVAVGTSVGVWAASRRREDLGVEEWVALAEIAADEGRYRDALLLVRRARAKAPTSTRLATTEAHLLALAGDTTAALAALVALSATDPSGEADLEAARLLVAWDPPRESDAGGHLARALELSPALLLELDGDPALLGLARDPKVANAIRQARREVGGA